MCACVHMGGEPIARSDNLEDREVMSLESPERGKYEKETQRNPTLILIKVRWGRERKADKRSGLCCNAPQQERELLGSSLGLFLGLACPEGLKGSLKRPSLGLHHLPFASWSR